MGHPTYQDQPAVAAVTSSPIPGGRPRLEHGAVGLALRSLKRKVAAVTKRSITTPPLPADVQLWAANHLLPLDPWGKSLTYQQCLANRIIRRCGLGVQTGPFRGMVCISDADEGCLVPKLLGCYEEELAPALEEFIAAGYDRVIDVGCASGYYVVGLATRMPAAEVFGFDTDEAAKARCRDLAARNNVGTRITLLGACTPGELQRLIRDRTLLIMDCDGPEYELLDPSAAPALRHCDVIVECHDFVNPAITATLEERFRESHFVEKIPARARVPDVTRLPGLSALPPGHWPEAVNEHRAHRQDWLVLRTR